MVVVVVVVVVVVPMIFLGMSCVHHAVCLEGNPYAKCRER